MYRAPGHRINKAVDGVSFYVNEKETVGLVGESGSGKTTLGKMITGLIKPNRGSLYWEGKRIDAGLRKEIQMVFQDSSAALNPRISVAGLVEESLIIQKVGDREERKNRVIQMLREVGLDEYVLERYPHQLSGGQRQRVALARTLILRPRLVVLDEPVSALDATAGARLLWLLGQLQQTFGLSFLMVSHNLAAVRQVCARVSVMYLGKIVETGAVEAVFNCPGHPYTRLLLDCHPLPDPRVRLAIISSGELPDPFSPPTGCRFHPRCSRMESKCRRIPPPQTEIRPDQTVACHRPLL
jgi:oligopeptide/dipeptide ABC transporter ATP-binding protein